MAVRLDLEMQAGSPPGARILREARSLAFGISNCSVNADVFLATPIVPWITIHLAANRTRP